MADIMLHHLAQRWISYRRRQRPCFRLEIRGRWFSLWIPGVRAMRKN